MSLLSHLAAGAAGYTVSELSKSHKLRDAVDQHLSRNNSRRDLRDIIREYAQARGIYTTNDELAYELHNIARTYESYNYPY